MINGSIFTSNKFGRADIIKSNTSCFTANNSAGPLAGKYVNEKASCLRCLKKAFNTSGDTDCVSPSHHEGCGPFRLQFEEWKIHLRRGDDFEDFKNCSMNEMCAGDAIWELTTGGDCNGDGVFDCDDRMQRLFNPACTVGGEDSRSEAEGDSYWKCRTDRRSDFVDIEVNNGRERYFCLNDYNLGRHWDKPERLAKIEPYVPVSKRISTENTEETTHAMTTTTPEIERETTTQLSMLRYFTINKSWNETLNDTQMKNIIGNISKLLDVSAAVLQKAQRDANVSSLPELLETILVRAPEDLNITMNNLAVSKKHAIGYQLLSDDPLDSDETFGGNPKQYPISNRKEIEDHWKRMEAAVILPPNTENVTVVIVTFAKGEDFTSCNGPRKSNKLTEIQKTDFSRSFDSRTANSVIHAATIHNESEEDLIEMDEEVMESQGECPYRKQFLRGCINTHVVQVGLLGNNGSYVQLPQGQTLDIILRTKVFPMPGQIKRCVYWNPKERGWSSEGCELIKNTSMPDSLDICRCSHLTHFAQLVMEADAVSGPQALILTKMSVTACMISLIGLAGVIVTGIVAPKWRRKKENKVMLNLAIAMSVYLALFLWSAVTPKKAVTIVRCKAQKPDMNCKGAGAALHYFVLASFCWMFVAAVAQYMRIHPFKDTSDISRFVLKASIIGWGLPVIPVAILLAIDADTYNGRGRDFCYPTGVAFYTAVLVPIFLVLVANLAILSLILRLIFPKCCVLNRKEREPDRFGGNEKTEMLRKLIVCVAFTFLFGLTWYLGLMSYTVVPAYFFCFVIMLQGPAFFIFFVLGEENVRAKFRTCAKRFRKDDEEPISRWDESSTTTTVLSGSGTRIKPESRIGPLQQKRRWPREFKLSPKKCATYTVNGTDSHEVQLH